MYKSPCLSAFHSHIWFGLVRSLPWNGCKIHVLAVLTQFVGKCILKERNQVKDKIIFQLAYYNFE